MSRSATRRPKAKSSRQAPPASSDPVTAYARAVESGEIVAGPWVRAACERHLRDLEHAGERGWRFDVVRVERAIAFFREVLRLNGGQFEGLPFVLQPWQAFCVGSIFGWIGADGFRRFRTAFMEIGKGNGKSPLAAGIGLYCLTSDGEARAEVYAAATKRDQAMILFRDAVAMRDLSPELASRLTKNGGTHCWNLSYPRTGSFFRAIASDDQGASGPRPHCSLIDEIHEHPTDVVIEMLKLGQKGRRQPLTVEITNSGVDRTSVCFGHHEYSTRVVDSRPGDADFNDNWFAYVCALDEGDDPLEDEDCWIKANPNLGISIKHEYLRDAVREARGMPAKASTVRRLNFCQWVDAESPWISGPLWLACEHEIDVLAELREADEVVGALDLSGAVDLSALALAGTIGEHILGRCDFWTPGETAVERAAKDRVPYPAWIGRGHLIATPGRGIDYSFIAQRIAELQGILPNLRRICYDPYRIKYLEQALDREGIEVELVPHPQGFNRAAARKNDDGEELPGLWMPRSIELLEKAVNDGALVVEKNPVLTWNSASAVLEENAAGARMFTKRRSRGRIDGIVALAMAVGLLLDGQPEQSAPEYQFFVV